MARSNRYLTGVLVMVLAACGSTSDTTSGRCTEPPASELQGSTEFTLSLSPDPVEAASDVELSVSAGASNADRAVVGAAVIWQCWDGAEWIDTHQVLRGHYGDYRVTALDPDVEVTMPAIGLLVPNTFTIQVPDVPPGIYRIADVVFVDGAQTLTVTVAVRVI